MLTERAAGLGAVNWLPLRDQVIRRVPLLVSVAGTLYPSLSLEALRLALKETTVFVRASGGSGAAGVRPADGRGKRARRHHRYADRRATASCGCASRAPTAQRYIPAHAVLDGSFDASEIAGRDMLIGTSAVGLLDLRATPLDAAVPGVEIHAQALEQMLSGDHLLRPAYATGAELAFLLGFGALVSWLIYRLGAVPAALIGALAILAVFAGSWLAYRGGLLFDPVYPSLAILLVYLATSLNDYVETESERNRVRSAFGHYVAAPLVEELARHPEKLKLGGETREVTVLFCDVRGFTHISEGLERRGRSSASSTGCSRRCRRSSSPSAAPSTSSWAMRSWRSGTRRSSTSITRATPAGPRCACGPSSSG